MEVFSFDPAAPDLSIHKMPALRNERRTSLAITVQVIIWLALMFWLGTVAESQEVFQLRAKPGGGLRTGSVNEIEAPAYCFLDNTCIRSAPSGGISGTTNHVPLFTSSNTIGNSTLIWDGTQFTTTANIKLGALGFPNGTYLREGAVNTLQMRNGTASQDFFLYGNYTDVSNNGGLQIHADASGTSSISSIANGSISPGDLFIEAPSGQAVRTHSNVTIGQGGAAGSVRLSMSNPGTSSTFDQLFFYTNDATAVSGLGGYIVDVATQPFEAGSEKNGSATKGVLLAGPVFIGAGSFVAPVDSLCIGCGVANGENTTPTASAQLDMRATNGALLLPRLTTTQRNALTAADGMVIYNTTNTTVEAHNNGSWAALPGAGGSSQVIQGLVGGGTCTTGTGAYATCTTTYTWGTAFADSGYAVTCTGLGASGTNPGAATLSIATFTASQVTVQVSNGSSSGAQALSFTNVDCIGVHP